MKLANTAINIVPSLPAASFDALAQLAIDVAEVVTELQIDIVDGVFVPAVAWPFTESTAVQEELQRIATLPKTILYEVDCMVVNPLQYLDTLAALGISRVIIHQHSTDMYDLCVAHARSHGYRIGIAVLPTVSVEKLMILVPQFDYVQVMGIAQVGKQGQPFAESALSVIAALRAAFPELEIAVDGSVNAETIPRLVSAGANRLAPGSAITRSANRAAAVRELASVANSQQA